MNNQHVTVKPTSIYAITHSMTDYYTQTLSSSHGISKELNGDTVQNVGVCMMLSTTIRRACIACLDHIRIAPCTE